MGLPLLMTGGALAGAGLGWLGSKIDDEGNSKYISKPIDWLTGDSVGGGALAGGTLGLGAGLGAKAAAPLAVRGTRLATRPFSSVSVPVGRSMVGAGKYAGAGAGGLGGLGMARAWMSDDDSVPATGGNQYSQPIGPPAPGGTFGGLTSPDVFKPMTLGFSPSAPPGAPSSNISDYAGDDLNEMLDDATAAANLPLKQGIKNRRRDEKRNLQAIQSMGRDTQRALRKTLAQQEKAQKEYEDLAEATEEAAADEAVDRANRMEQHNPKGPGSDDIVNRTADTERELRNATSNRGRDAHRSFIDLMEDLAEGDTYGVQDDVTTEIQDSQDDINDLRDKMASNAASINTDYRNQLAQANMNAAMNRYSQDSSNWYNTNQMRFNTARSNMEAMSNAQQRNATLLNMYLQGLGGGGSDIDPVNINIPISNPQSAAAYGLPWYGSEMEISGTAPAFEQYIQSMGG